MFHGEEVVARRDPRAALVYDPTGVAAAEYAIKLVFEVVRVLEAAARIKVPLEEAVRSAWNVAGNRIERLTLTLESFGAPRIDQRHFGVTQMRRDVRGVDGKLRTRPECIRGVLNRRLISRNGIARARPAVPAAIEHCDPPMTDPSQHPPQTCSEATAARVVRNNLFVVVDTQRAQT